ncbi:unnamed protein product [Fusarium venenatum]|uniref:Uncharacterized protein n=1 Tax=Fusarium venenatum TaxID=56646 RepID=A0A2L2SNP5_9HYPO|nr:uncharacterized protein FVRRES_11915 [Fusarium venenatum]CEI39224.1 unnamed protein product [Fusarium venenatum]
MFGFIGAVPQWMGPHRMEAQWMDLDSIQGKPSNQPWLINFSANYHGCCDQSPKSWATKSKNLSSHLAPLFLMHILLPTVQRRHKHPNTDQDISGKSHRLYYHARFP